MINFLLFVVAIFVFFPCPAAEAVEARNVRLIGYSDLQGRETLQVSVKGNYAYVGHHRGEEFNALTGKAESNGTTILDVSNPREPRILKHIPGYKGSESRAVHPVEKYFDGKDYIIRNQESGEFTGFEVWDVTDKGNPKRVSQIGPLGAAHKSWWDAKTGYAYLSGIWPGWRGQHLIIYDLKDPANPKHVANWGLPGQRPEDPSKERLSLHHPVIFGDRAYLSYLGGGDMVVLDIFDKASPKMISHLDFSPPFSGIHTTAPFNGMKVPNYTKGYGDVRNFLVLSEEDFGGACQGLRKQLYVVDATEETNPIPVATFKVSDGDFCDRGGWFGPHQFAETKNGEIIGGSLVYVAYFSGGLRVWDISDPFHPGEVGYFIPDTTEKTKPRGKKVIQTNDADLDYRGLIYITDRAGTGLHILEYTPGK
ncbi:MAG TPA: hypothetical protein VLS90_19785 [Thermodesulfobacteriota bacterium]|nr:hypothetical protein [Thermodesulfobacteriota bacterium]